MSGPGRRWFLRLQAENGVSMFTHGLGYVFQGFSAAQADGSGLTWRHAFEQKLGFDKRERTDLLSYVKKEISIPFYAVF